MSFDDLMRDTITLHKTDGTKTPGLKASVQKNKVFMNADGVLVQSGDLLIRSMSNGAEETYRVIDPGFYEGFGGIPANYQMDVEKLGLPEAKAAIKSITYNFTGDNNRVNHGSVDNSTNIAHTDNRIGQYIDALKNEINGSSLTAAEKVEANEVINEVNNVFHAGTPKKSVISALLSALPSVAKVTSIAASILKLLGGG